MPRHELLIGAPAFWARAKADIAAARRRVLVQAMTFEGDATGLAVADALLASPAAMRRVAVDDYTRWVINDQWINSRRGRRDPGLQAEARATTAMFARLEAGGVEVAWTEPVGLRWRDYPFRNHRKLIVADDVAYVGGVNFSDHNFAWADLMVRLDRADAADVLAADFPVIDDTSPKTWRMELDGLTLHGLDGRTNPQGFTPLIARLDAARDEIVVFSPYLTFPFTDALARARRRGVRVVVVTPARNNKPLLHDYIVHRARCDGLELIRTPQMSHVKALMIDGESLTLGSSNFDFVSYDGEAELLATFDDPELIAVLRRELLEPALGQAVAGEARVSLASGLKATAALRLAQGYIRVLKRIRQA